MDKTNQPTDADLVAEANHFRTQAIEQEVETGERMPLKGDPELASLPTGLGKTRPVFPKDDAA